MRKKKAETKEVALNTTPGDEETTARMRKKKAETKEMALNTTPGDEDLDDGEDAEEEGRDKGGGVALNSEEEMTAEMRKKKAETKEVALNTTPGEEETTAKMP